MAKTKTGEKTSKYVQDVLGTASKGGKAAVEAGYPELSRYTKAYLRGLPGLKEYGDAEQRQALRRVGDLYGDYRRAGDYDMTSFRDLERQYGRAGEYDTTDYADVERMYRQAGQYGPEEFSGIQRQLDQAGQYDPTQFGDLELGSLAQSQYDPSQFDRADYTTANIQERMSPYEELVAKRATDRLQRQFEEADASRALEAARAGAFGGSGAAVSKEVARRSMQEQMADVNAQSLQSAYESAVGLYGKEFADNMAAQQAEEQSRQFGGQLGLEGIRQAMAARQAEEASRQFGSQTGLQALQQKFAAQQAGEASRQFGQQAEFQGLEGLMAARGAEEASRQFGSQLGMQGLAGQMAARQQQAGQVAAAKEAELASLSGRSQSAREQALLAEQRKNMQLANLAALQQGGQYQQAYNLARRQYPLDIAQQQANVLGTMASGSQQLLQKPDQPSMFQNILGTAGAAAGLLQGVGSFFRDGGVVYRGGGLADLEPQYYDRYER
jgi:hypothetical protein